jgi:exopolysaccharide production protein ExoQ
MKTFLRFAENGFAVLALLLFTGALLPTLYAIRTGDHAGNNLEGNTDLIIAFFIIYAITFCLVILRWKKVLFAITKKRILLILVGIALASVFWSVLPGITFRRSIALLGTTLFGVYLATRYSLNEQFRLLTWTLGIAIVLSILFALLLPAYGIHQNGDFLGQWKGIYIHKNTLGRNMGFSLYVFSLLAFWGSKYRWIGFAGCVLAALLIFLSGSITPVFSTLTVLILLPLYSILRWRYSLTLFFFLIAVMVNIIGVTLLLNSAETIVGNFGRDLTFTGRTKLWFVLFEMIQQRPWLGYGYTAFWLGGQSEDARVWSVIPWQPDYAHNGYIDLALQVGLVGVVIFAIDFLLNFSRAVTLAAATRNAAGMFPIAFLTFVLPFSISESMILKQNDIFWVLYVSTALSMVLQPVKLRTRNYFKLA